jgi:hypothetical protein
MASSAVVPLADMLGSGMTGGGATAVALAKSPACSGSLRDAGRISRSVLVGKALRVCAMV